MEKEVFKIQEAANYIGISSQTLRNWNKKGIIKSQRGKSGHRLFLKEDLDNAKILSKPKRITSVSKKSSLYLKESDFKRVISKLHKIVRNHESKSGSFYVFDELTKVLISYIDIKEKNKSVNSKILKDNYEIFINNFDHFSVPEEYKVIRLNNDCISSIIKELEKTNFFETKNDAKGILYEEIIKNTFEKGEHQQFFTPKTIVDFMINAIKPYSSKKSICDPASGTGGFLIGAIRNKIQYKNLISMEIDERLAWVSAINLYFAGCKNYKVFCYQDGGTLGKEALFHKNTIDIIVTNPPFGSDFVDQNSLQSYNLGKNKTSRRRGVLFIERCLELLKNYGYLAIIIDDGVLNSNSNIDVRKLILEKSEVLGIIKLPENAFMPYASVNASILFLRKNDQGHKNRSVFFGKANNIGKKGNGQEDYVYTNNGNITLNNDLVYLLEKWIDFISGKQINDSEDYYVADILQNYNFFKDESYRLDFSYHHYTRMETFKNLYEYKDRMVSIKDICEEINEPVVPTKNLSGMIPYIGLANIEPYTGVYQKSIVPASSIKSHVKKFKKGDILFSKMRPELRKCVAITDDEGYCSSECIVFRPKSKNNINTIVLSAMLRSNFVYGQIIHLISGIGRPRVSIKDVRRILIPDPRNINNIEKFYSKQIEKVEKMKNQANKLMQEAKKLETGINEQIIKKLLDY